MKKMNTKLLILLLFSCYAVVAQAGSGAWGWLTDSIVSEFDKEDSESFKAFVREHIATLGDKEKASWKSENNEFRGIIKPEVSYELDGIPCRQVKFALKGKNDRTNISKFDVCKRDDQWKIVRSPLTSFEKEDWESLKTELEQVLNQGEDGFPVTWSMRKTGVTGTIVPLNQHKYKGMSCRDTAISVANSNGHTASGHYTLCKTDGQWERIQKK